MKKIFSIILASSLMFSLAACGSKAESPKKEEPVVETPVAEEEPEEEEPAEKLEKVSLRVAFMPNMGSGSALITGINMGYFEEQGLDIKLTEFQGGPAEIAAMASGEIDIAQIGHGAHALAIEGEAKIIAMDLLGISDELLANKTLGIETAADLKGKTIASTAGTSAEIVLDLILRDAGLTQDDVNVVEMDANGAVSAMVSGNVDAAATWAPSTTIIQEKMGEDVISLGSNGDYIDTVTFPGSFITTDKFAADNEDILVRFIAALMKAQDYRAANIEEVAVWLAEEVEADPGIMLETKDSGKWLTGDFLTGAVADGTVEDYYMSQQKVFIDSERIPAEVPVSDYVLFDIMQKGVDRYNASK